nr:RNA-directed DNA polymerase, eukaryota [Tanacetum cinerariifolium]
MCMLGRIIQWWDISDEEFNAYEEWLSWIVNIRLPSKKKMTLEDHLNTKETYIKSQVDGSRDVDSKKKNLKTCGDDSDLEEVQDNVFEEKGESNHNVDENSSGLKENHSEDPFGFTPNEESDTLDVNKEDNSTKIGHTGKSIDLKSGCSGHFKQSEIPCSGGSILNLMEELVKAKKDWVKELCAKHKVNFLALQETKMENMANSTVKMCWGNLAFNFVHSDFVGFSGGNDLLFVAVYAPHDLGKKRRLWDYLVHVIQKWHGEVVIMGDFNEEWNKNKMINMKIVKENYKRELEAVEMIIDKSEGNDDIVNTRMGIIKSLQDIDKHQAMELAQKAKVQWSIEGDENSKLSHGILNKKQSPLNIRGIMIDGVRAKKAVWDCDTEKSSGPDGFTFGFYRRFWKIIKSDVFEAVKQFFTLGKLPKGCNSCFIALILKIPDANLVKDFREISLIGSLYKIIAKILANHLVGVLGDIVHEVQYAFIGDRQILDGPFILNEKLQ